MSTSSWRIVLGGLALMTLGGGVALMMAVHAAPTPGTPTEKGRTGDPFPLSAGSAPPLDSTVPRGGLFRVTRSPAPVPFDAHGEQLAVAAVEPRPTLALAGLVLGTTRAALIRGLPGHEAVQVLAEGDEVGGVRLVRVDSVTAVLIWRSDTLRVALPRERS